MKYCKLKFLSIMMPLLWVPTSVNASSYNSSLNISSVINFNAIVQSGAVVNNITNNNNINVVIVGMIVIIVVLVGAAMFAPKK